MSEPVIRIGLVEDDPLDVKLLQLMLNKPPKILHELHQSSSLDEALHLLRNETLDVMLLDLGLPDAQGLEVFHQVKSYAPNLPVIIFSGQDDKDIALRAVAEGAQDYLVKGKTNAHTIKRTILHAIERQRATHEKLVHAIFSSAANGIVTTKLDGEFILTNPAYCKMVGYSEAELSALSLYALIHPDDRTRNLELTNSLLAGEINDFSAEERYIKKDGDIVWVHANVSLERSADGQPLNIITVSESITERKRAEDALQEREEQLRLYAEHSPAAIAMLDRDMNYLVVSSRWMEVYRLGDKSIIGRSHYEIFPEIPQRWREIHQRCMAGAIEKCEEDSLLREDGRTDWIRWEIRPWRRADNSIGGIIIFSEDITIRKQAEELLHESEYRTRAILDSALDAVIGMDDGGRVTDWNPRAESIFGWSKEEALGQELAGMIIPEQHQEAHRRGLARFITTGESRVLNRRIEITAVRRNGEEFPVELAITLLKINDTHHFTAFIADLTERKKSELDLARLNRALRMLSSCNELLIHATDEKQLLSGICQLAVETGGYHMAWVGYAQNDATHSVKPMGYAGPRADYLSEIKVSWSEADPIGRGPSGKAIRSGAAVVCEDVTQDPDFAPWLKMAQKYGYRGVTCLPLRDKKHVFGMLALHSAEVRSISNDELKLLRELADDLAFGIINIRNHDEQQRIQSAISKIAASVSASSGTEFFQQLVLSMTEALGAQAGFFSQLLPGKPLRARTIAAIVDGKAIDNMEYVIAGTPCENIISDDNYAVLNKAVKCFPHAPTLVALGMQAYVGRRLLSSAGRPIGQLFALFRDPLKQADFVTSTLQIFGARAAAELERQEADKRFLDQASLLDKAQDAIVVRGLDHIIQFWNKGAERLYGWTAAEAVGLSSVELLYDDRSSYDEICEKVLEFGEWSGEITQHRKDGSVVIVEAHWNLVRDDNNEPHSILAINTDISQRKAAEKKIEHLAFYDNLTGLANRLLLADRLQLALASSVRESKTGALLFIDLDNFKILNDTLGHDMGDLLLQQVAHRLVNCVRESDTVARLGGDEFVVMLEGMSQIPHEAAAHAKIVGEKILASFNQPFQLAGHEHYTSPSIGIALFSDQLNTAEELLKRADIAMYQAKASGRNTMRFFDPEMQAVISARVALEADLHEALQQSQFLLHYQPQINREGRIIGAEALVRWQHPVRGLVPPIKFIPATEETGLILLLGHWVLETACAQLTTWAAKRETASLTISVNVSARQFRQPDFVEQVLAVVDYTGANPERLKLELTESLLADNTEDIIAKMVALKASGIGFSLDDFGIGYSSLAYLKRLPLDQLKIDQSFVRDVLTDPNDAAIARTILALGQSLGMVVVAEGVETKDQHNFLAKEGCNVYQGYYFSRPIPIEQFEEYRLAIKKTSQKKKAKTGK